MSDMKQYLERELVNALRKRNAAVAAFTKQSSRAEGEAFDAWYARWEAAKADMERVERAFEHAALGLAECLAEELA